MRLSEAIRLGALMHPQGFGTIVGAHDLRSAFDKSKIQVTCALGAAWVASGGEMHEDIAAATSGSTTLRGYAQPGSRVLRLDLPIAWHGTLATEVVCPEFCCEHRGILMCCIEHLNDEHRWTREAIADFVEQMEGTIAAPAVRDVSEPPVPTREASVSSSVT
jgi:hypothetical protein